MKEKNNVMILSLTSNDELANKICSKLKIEKGLSTVEHFADGETVVKLGETVRGKKVFVIQSLCNPVNDKLMELLICVDALKRSSADEITCVCPYMGYSRQDRMMEPRQPISAKLIANLITSAGADRVVVYDLHAAQIQGFYDIPVDNITLVNAFGKYYKNKKLKNIIVVSPDHGGVKRARALADILNTDIAIVDKRRPRANVCEAVNIIGDVKDKNCIIIDDIIDTGGSITATSEILKRNGAKDVYIGITHGVLSGDAVSKIDSSLIKELVISDSIPLRKNSSKIKVIDTSSMLAKMILAIANKTSVGKVYEEI